MGRDKALVQWRGRPLVVRAAESLAASFDQVLLATGPEARYADLVPTARIVLDAPCGDDSSSDDSSSDGSSSDGPLGGIAALLAAAEAEWLVTLPVDMPHVEGTHLRTLWERAAEAGVDAAFVRSERGVEPLLAAYRISAARPAARALLAAGVRRPLGLLDEVAAIEVGIETLTDEPARVLRNLNTPADLAVASETASEGAA